MPTTPMCCRSICRRLSEAVLAALLLAAGPALAADPPAPAQALDTRIQDLKAEVIALNRDLLVLE